MLAVGSFRVSRLLAFFAISAVMLLGPEIGGLFHRRAAGESRGTTVRWAPAAVLAFALILAGMATLIGLSCVYLAVRLAALGSVAKEFAPSRTSATADPTSASTLPGSAVIARSKTYGPPRLQGGFVEIGC